MTFTDVIHHGAKFVGEPNVRYEGGKVTAIHNVDINKWSYFGALSLVKDLRYDETVKLWWKVPGKTLNDGLKNISQDSHALEMGSYALNCSCKVDMYVEHAVAEPNLVLELTCEGLQCDADKGGEARKVLAQVAGEGLG